MALCRVCLKCYKYMNKYYLDLSQNYNHYNQEIFIIMFFFLNLVNIT